MRFTGEKKEEDMGKTVSRIAYIYLALPFIIFALGFMRWYIGIPAALIACWGVYCMWRDADEFEIKPRENRDYLVLLLALITVMGWVILSGVGNVVWGNIDHLWRNAMFKILVDYDWPPVNAAGRGLTYYIGFWLPSALVGKILGLQAGFIFQIIWTTLGLYLVYLYICEHLKRISVFPLIVFIFFSGLDFAGVHMFDPLIHEFRHVPLTMHIETWAGPYTYNYSCNTSQLFWAFNQCVYSWLILMIVLKNKTNKYVVFQMGLLLISSIFGFIGMLPLLLYLVIKRRGLFSIQNFLCGGVSGILTFLYYLGNETSQLNPGSFADTVSSGNLTHNLRLEIVRYVIFIFWEVLIYLILCFGRNKKNPLFYVMAAFLFICPLIKFGLAHDFCMRASVPSLLLLMLFVLDTLYDAIRRSRRVLVVLISITLLIGAVTPFYEFSSTLIYTCANEPHFFGTESHIFDETNFSCDAESTFFFRYIGRK